MGCTIPVQVIYREEHRPGFTTALTMFAVVSKGFEFQLLVMFPITDSMGLPVGFLSASRPMRGRVYCRHL